MIYPRPWKRCKLRSIKRLNMLSNIALFCLAAALDSLSKGTVKKRLLSHPILLSEGDRTDSLYSICRGKVKVEISDKYGEEIILAMPVPREYLGEMVPLGGKPMSPSPSVPLTPPAPSLTYPWHYVSIVSPEIFLTEAIFVGRGCQLRSC